MAAPSWYQLIPDNLPNVYTVCVGQDLAKQLDGATGYNLKGFVFKKLCEAACSKGFQVFDEVKQNPQQILDIVQQDS